MNKKEYILEEKDCAKMLGMSLEEYRVSIETVVAPRFERENKEKQKKDDDILKQLGIDKKILKKGA